MASIKQRNNKYCVIYTYTDPSGNRKQKWETFKTKDEAERRKTEVEYKKKRRKHFVTNCVTMSELLQEYVSLYGRETWSLSYYAGQVSTIEHYIEPLIGHIRITEISTRHLEKYYQDLLTYPEVPNCATGKPANKYVTPSTIGRIHKLLKSCFNQAVKWELIEKNPTFNATVPKYKPKKREIWDAETLMRALDLCENEKLKLAMSLTFTGTLLIGELLALTWDCTDISEEAVNENRAYISIEKELQRVKKEALHALSNKDVILVFPESTSRNSTVRVLKALKTESSIRKVFLPRTVALMLADWKVKQDEMKEAFGDEYKDYNLVLTSTFGMPLTTSYIRKEWNKLIEENDLDPVVFHSLRHTSVTYKLKLNGGDIKSVQGDSGHAQVDMVTDVYSHIIDEDRKKNAELFENAFFTGRCTDPAMARSKMVAIPDGVDPELISKVLSNPEMMALLSTMAAAMKK